MSEPLTVCLVEVGAYSDRCAVGVFSTRQLAEEYCAANNFDDSCIIDMVLDAERLILHDWVCILSYETGEQVTCDQETSEQHWYADAKLYQNCTIVAAWGQSAEHAVKNAADFRAQRIAHRKLDEAWEREKSECAARAASASETSEWIAQRNAARGEQVFSGVSEPEGFVFEPQPEDPKAMMDPFYDMWVAGVKLMTDTIEITNIQQLSYPAPGENFRRDGIALTARSNAEREEIADRLMANLPKGKVPFKLPYPSGGNVLCYQPRYYGHVRYVQFYDAACDESIGRMDLGYGDEAERI